MERRQLPADFKEFIDFLNSNEVEYLLLGGWAVGFYGFPRATKDIDFLISIEEANLGRLKAALKCFGTPDIDMGNFGTRGFVFRMGRSPIQIDIINQAAGVDFRACYQRRNVLEVDGTPISMISKTDLIANKKAAGRTQDLADAEALEKAS